MKKALAIISAVALVSAVAFAEDGVKISGQIETGIQAQTGDGADYVKLWETDAPGATRIDLNVTATQGDTGLWFKLRSTDGTESPKVVNFKTYANLFNNQVTLTAGNPDDAVWKTDADSDYTFENGYGVRLEVKPVAGLNLGVKLNTATPGSTQYTPKQMLNELGFGAKYTTDKFFVAGGYKLDSDADDANATTTTTQYVDTSDTPLDGAGGTVYEVHTYTSTVASDYAKKEQSAYVGFNYFGTKGLLFQSEAIWTGLGKYSDIGTLTANEVVEYQVNDPTKVGLLVYEYVYGDSDLKTGFKIKPYVNYKVNAVTLAKAEVGYVINKSGTKDYNEFWLSPGAEFQLTSNSQIRTDYTYDIDDTGDKASGKATTHKLNLGFRYNF